MKTALFVHGFNVFDRGKSTTDRLIPHFENHFKIKQFDYGWTGLLGVRFLNNLRARIISDIAEPDWVGVGHSNGCALLYQASLTNKKFEHLILINPALDSDVEFPSHLKTITVYHNRHDNTVTMSRFLPWHIWGDMGNVGATRKDPRVINLDEDFLFGVRGHSNIFAHDDVLSEIKYSFLRRQLLNR